MPSPRRSAASSSWRALCRTAPSPLARTVVEALRVNGNPQLPQLSLPSLSSVAGYVYVAQNCALQSLSMPNLSSVNGEYVFVQCNTALGSTPVSTLDARLSLVGFSGTRTLAAGACGEPSCSGAK